jgi:CheY-like chemotaxis protein
VRLAQVFSNLLINAAKYTDSGGRIQLRATREGDDVVVSVRDNGIGIPTELMPRLFTLFTQASGHSEGGLGVGLSLVRGIVELHNGRVEAYSPGTNQGSEFTVRLPIGAAEPHLEGVRAEPQQLNGQAGLRILLADDTRDAAETCSILLELSGHQVLTAFTARGALELAEKFRPHALLLDIGLPDMDGYQLAERIRAAVWGKSAVLIALSGWGRDDDRMRAFAAGFDHHLTKPITGAALETLLQGVSSALKFSELGKAPD